MGLLISLSVNGQNRLSTKSPYKVGLCTLQVYDTQRNFDSTRTDSLRFRPVKIDLFYPATNQPDKSLLPYQFFLNLYSSNHLKSLA